METCHQHDCVVVYKHNYYGCPVCRLEEEKDGKIKTLQNRVDELEHDLEDANQTISYLIKPT